MSARDQKIDGSKKKSHDIRYFDDGISREKSKDGFNYYYNLNKKPVTKEDLQRIKSLVIPPALKNVWISSDPNAAIQAIGIDNKGRKQYKYHQKHIAESERKKYLKVLDFIAKTPKLDIVINKDSKKDDYDYNKVISTILTIIKELHMRVGKDEYAKRNKSYGASSLLKKHVTLGTDTIIFRFKGKSRQKLHYTLKNIRIKEHIESLMKLPGDRLFKYIRSDKKIKNVTYRDINDYIHEHMGEEFTIKDFRTYAANLHFVKYLMEETKKRKPKNKTVVKKNIKNAFEKTARKLKHTKAISKKSYVASFCIELYTSDPDYFIQRVNKSPQEVLINILTLYRKRVLLTKN